MSPFTTICNGKSTAATTNTTLTAGTAAAASAAPVTAAQSADTEATAVTAIIEATASSTGTGTADSSAATTKTAVAVGVAAAGGGGGGVAMAKAANIMCFQNVIVVLTLLLCGLASANGLKCHMCGQYNEGVGSITPCLNYSDQYAHLYLKECSKKSEKFCVKYVSELSIVRDCATECVEKEIWETQTYCCNEDGCNGSRHLEASKLLLLMPLLYFIYNVAFAGHNLRH